MSTQEVVYLDNKIEKNKKKTDDLYNTMFYEKNYSTPTLVATIPVSADNYSIGGDSYIEADNAIYFTLNGKANTAAANTFKIMKYDLLTNSVSTFKSATSTTSFSNMPVVALGKINNIYYFLTQSSSSATKSYIIRLDQLSTKVEFTNSSGYTAPDKILVKNNKMYMAWGSSGTTYGYLWEFDGSNIRSIMSSGSNNYSGAITGMVIKSNNLYTLTAFFNSGRDPEYQLIDITHGKKPIPLVVNVVGNPDYFITNKGYGSSQYIDENEYIYFYCGTMDWNRPAAGIADRRLVIKDGVGYLQINIGANSILLNTSFYNCVPFYENNQYRWFYVRGGAISIYRQEVL